MSFALTGTHIDGGTFNSVSGNMSQVYNSHVVHLSAPADPRPPNVVDGLTSSTLTTGSIERLRPQRTVRDENTGPYAIADRGHRHRHHQDIQPPDWNGPSLGESGNALRPTDAAENIGRMAACDPLAFAPPRTIGFSPDNISNTFNNVGGNMIQLSVTSYGESGIDILYRSVVMEVLHDSGERFPEPACHPGTRTEVLDELRSWSTDTSPESTILWLHGSAGVGKSAIAQVFAGDCQSQGRLGGSYFFRRGHPGRGTWHGLFTTIAYQLARAVPEFMLPLQAVMDLDPLVIGRAMAVQFTRLLVESFHNTPELQFRPIIVLDGLDECEDHKTQQQILRLFMQGIQSNQLPIRLLIASRPEPHIREILEADTAGNCHQYILSADESADEDIRAYFRDEFSRIHSNYMARGIDLGAVWPDADELGHLVDKSSGIFIYANTVIRFIDDEYSHPGDRLAAVLSLDPRSTAPLDDLYTEILSVISPNSPHLLILHAIWRGGFGDFMMDPEEIDVVLDLRRGTSRLALRGLHSLVDVPRIRPRFGLRSPIRVLHASLG
ncbi:hypothetical protein DFH09DRAFT_984206, partial [Mycena vulgaris]